MIACLEMGAGKKDVIWVAKMTEKMSMSISFFFLFPSKIFAIRLLKYIIGGWISLIWILYCTDGWNFVIQIWLQSFQTYLARILLVIKLLAVNRFLF